MHRKTAFLICGAGGLMICGILSFGRPAAPPANPGTPAPPLSGLSRPDALRIAFRICGVELDDHRENDLVNGSHDGTGEVGGVVVEPPLAGTVSEQLMDLPAIVPADNGRFLVVAGRETATDQLLVFRSAGPGEWISSSAVLPWPDSTRVLRRQQPAGQGPRLWMALNQVSLGTLEIGGVHRHEVPILNVGDAPLEVTGAFASCPCTKVAAVPSQLQPGEAGRLFLAIDTRELSSRAFRVDVGIRTNANSDAGTSVPVTATLIQPAGFDQRQFALGDLPPTQTRVELTSEFDCPECGSVTVEPVYLDRGLQWGRVEQTVKERTRIRFSLDLTDVQADAEGKFECRMFVRPSGNDVKKVHEFVVKGRKLPWIEAAPSTVFAGRLLPGQTRRFKVQLRSFAHGGVETHVPVPEMVRTEVLDSSSVAIEVTAPAPEGMFRTTVLLQVGTRSLNLPIVGVVDRLGARQATGSEEQRDTGDSPPPREPPLPDAQVNRTLTPDNQ